MEDYFMAHSANTGSCCLRSCLTSLIVLLVIVALIVGGIWYVLNMTFDELGIADEPIFGETTIRQLGLADKKIIDVIKALNDILKEPNESDIVHNPYNRLEAEANIAGELGLIIPKKNGKPDYAALMNGNLATEDGRYLVTLLDTDIAYLMQTIIEQAEDNDNMEAVREQPMNIREVTIKEINDKYSLKVIVKLDLAYMMDDLTAQLESLPGSNMLINAIPKAIYFIGTSEITVDEFGKVNVSNKQLSVNGTTNFLIDIIMENLNKKVSEGENLPGEEDADFGELLAEALSESFVILIDNIGEVGFADTDASNIVTGDIELGMVGLSDHQICMITRLAEAPVSE